MFSGRMVGLSNFQTAENLNGKRLKWQRTRMSKVYRASAGCKLSSRRCQLQSLKLAKVAIGYRVCNYRVCNWPHSQQLVTELQSELYLAEWKDVKDLRFVACFTLLSFYKWRPCEKRVAVWNFIILSFFSVFQFANCNHRSSNGEF